MSRLTKWNGKKYVLPQGRTSDGQSYWQLIAERLAAYENTGLEPWQITPAEKPKGYCIEIHCGDCFHRELWYGLPSELPQRMDEIGATARKDWGWSNAGVTATEWTIKKED